MPTIIHPVVVGAASNNAGTSLGGSQSVTVTLASNQGDLLVAHFASRDGNQLPTHSAPSGWTQLSQTGTGASNRRSSWWVRIMPASPPSTHQFSSSGGSGLNHHRVAAGIFRITGHHPTNPIDGVHNSQSNSTGTAPSVTTNRENSLLLGQWATPGLNLSPPGGMTQSYHDSNSGALGIEPIQVLGAWEDRGAAGATGTRVASGNLDNGMNALTGIRPFLTHEVDFLAQGIGDAHMERLLSLQRSFEATGLGDAELARRLELFRTMQASGVGIADIARTISGKRSFGVQGVGRSTTDRSLSLNRDLDAQGVGRATTSPFPKKVITATGVGVATQERQATFLRSQDAEGVGVASIDRSLSLFRPHTASGVGSSSATRVLSAFRDFHVVGVGRVPRPGFRICAPIRAIGPFEPVGGGAVVQLAEVVQIDLIEGGGLRTGTRFPIRITRNAAAVMHFLFKDASGAPIDITDAVIQVDYKRKPYDPAPLFSKSVGSGITILPQSGNTLGKAQVDFTPANTASLSNQQHVLFYDVDITIPDAIHPSSPLVPLRIIVDPEIT